MFGSSLFIVGSGDAPIATSIQITPSSYKMPQNEAYQFSAVVLDQNGNPMAGSPTFTELRPDGSANFDINAQAGFFERWKATSLLGTFEPNAAINNWVGAGGSRTFANATSTKRPLLIRPVNTRPYLQFDGADDYLDWVGAGLTLPFTMYWVVRFRTWVANARLWEASNGSSNGTALQQNSSPQIGMYSTAQGPRTAVGQSPTLNTLGILTCVYSSSTPLIQWNNLTADTSGVMAAIAPTGIRMCAESTAGLAPTAADVYELTIRTGADDATTRGNHKAQLAWEYGLVI